MELLKGFCNIAKLPVETRPEWEKLYLDNDYNISFCVIGGCILYSIPEGYDSDEGTIEGLRNRKRVLIESGLFDHQYTEIVNYSLFKGQPSRKIRLEFKRQLFNEIDSGRLLGFWVINASRLISWAYNVAYSIYKPKIPFAIVKNYETAIKNAKSVLSKKDKNTFQYFNKVNQESNHVRELLNYIREINWESQGLPDDDIPNNHPYRQVFDALGILKQDLDELMLKNQRTEESLQEREEELRQAQKMEAVGNLASGIAHDFNNILSIILGNAEFAKYYMPPNHHLGKHIDHIVDACLRGEQVIRHLLHFSRKKKNTRYPLRMGPLIKEAIGILRPLIPANVKIQQNFDDVTIEALVDPTEIHQIIISLCTNAYQAMSQRGGVIDLKLDTITIDGQTQEKYRVRTFGRYIRLIVSDTGKGIAPENLNRIFEPYFTTKEPGTGSGLGLSVVHGIAKSCDGVITVSSEIDKGTTFTLLFPEAVSVISKDAHSENAVLFTGNESILFVDDEWHLGIIEKDILEKLGYRVSFTNKPIEALNLFKSNPSQFDLIITDMVMPEMSGTELAQNIFKINPVMPIILCTGSAEDMDDYKARKIGFKAFFTKPIKMMELSAIVRMVLDEKQN